MGYSTSMSTEWFDLLPGLSTKDRVLRVAVACAKAITKADQTDDESLINAQDARAECLGKATRCRPDPQMAQVIVSVLHDLREQGWEFRIVKKRLQALKPTFEVDEENTPEEVKAQIRTGLLLERDVQLQQLATRRFVYDMERRRLGPNGWVSIFSLMRDGAGLAEQLRAAADLPRGAEREQALRSVIDPYTQVVDDSRCKYTWLRLKDIWRYFRYTWSIPSQSVPGRNIWFLIRDRAAEHHPVIGIAALGSAIVQLKPRDKWIGWHPDTFLPELEADPSLKWACWVQESWEQLIAEIYIEDFLQDGLLDPAELAKPTRETIVRLETYAKEQRECHRLYPKTAEHKADIAGADWTERAQTYLFRSKRAKTLARLLRAKLRLRKAGFDFGQPSAVALKEVLSQTEGRSAIASILRRMKARHVGIGMMDITVCGAVPPYNPVLGGKLVSLLMTSPEVVEAYRRRYQEQPSIIASSMAGRPVVRKPQLVFLGTTSLYGVGSSQYNRVRLPAAEVGGQEGQEIRYENLEQTKGYGSFHLSGSTLSEIEKLLAQRGNSRRVNSIFGEGVNPRLRKVRDALEVVGFASDEVLQHENKRIIYGIPLATNFRAVLLGADRTAEWILPKDNPEQTTSAIADFWIRRWLSKRIENERFLVKIAEHTLTYPIEHGARVDLPPVVEEETLFAD